MTLNMHSCLSQNMGKRRERRAKRKSKYCANTTASNARKLFLHKISRTKYFLLYIIYGFGNSPNLGKMNSFYFVSFLERTIHEVQGKNWAIAENRKCLNRNHFLGKNNFVWSKSGGRERGLFSMNLITHDDFRFHISVLPDQFRNWNFLFLFGHLLQNTGSLHGVNCNARKLETQKIWSRKTSV